MANRPQSCSRRPYPARRRRGGFSFAEVMFAVIILGIGFIMVAAIFPVAIQQTRLTVDESTAAGIARDAAALLQRIAVGSETAAGTPPTQPLFPKSGTAGNPASVYSVRSLGYPQPAGGGTDPPDDLWQRIRGDAIVSGDPRFAWAALYSREDGSQFVRLYLIVLQQRTRDTFESKDHVIPGSPGAPVNLQPRSIKITTEPAAAGAADPDTILIGTGAQFAAEGAFVITADAALGSAGQVYRLGALRGNEANGDRYEVDPAYDIPDAPAGSYNNGDAWIVGRGFALNPTSNRPDPTMAPVGPAMDVAIYTTFMRVN